MLEKCSHFHYPMANLRNVLQTANRFADFFVDSSIFLERWNDSLVVDVAGDEFQVDYVAAIKDISVAGKYSSPPLNVHSFESMPAVVADKCFHSSKHTTTVLWFTGTKIEDRCVK
mgnify:CR=1 FL=1